MGGDADPVLVSSSLIISVRTFLSTRSDRIKDENTLAYETAVIVLLGLSEPLPVREHAVD